MTQEENHGGHVLGVYTLNIHTLKRALYTLERALYTLKRALYTHERALHTLKKDLYKAHDVKLFLGGNFCGHVLGVYLHLYTNTCPHQDLRVMAHI